MVSQIQVDNTAAYIPGSNPAWDINDQMVASAPAIYIDRVPSFYYQLKTFFSQILYYPMVQPRLVPVMPS